MNLRATLLKAASVGIASVLFVSSSLLNGCGSSGDSAVAKIGDYSLSLKDYERQYLKNNGGIAAADTSTLTGRRDFLQLLVKYRLKVLEAREKGYDKDPEIVKELAEYRNSLAVPYVTERAIVDPNIKILYDRRLEEMRAAHILIRVQPDSTGNTDTTAAYAEALRVLALARQGERFDSLAVRYSQDPGTAKTGGDLLYFSAGMTVPAFDDAVYSMKPGEVYARPVRTLFGYHVIKLLDRKPTRGEIEVSHILVRFPQENQTDTLAAFTKISSVLDTLRKGGDFKELARRNSDDPSSGERGGDLGWVGRRRFVPEFEMVAFDLSVGGTSGIVRTPFGYHLIKVTGERTAKPFDESRQELKDIYKRYGYEDDNKAFIAAVERKYNVTVNEATVQQVAAGVDTASTTSVPGWYNALSPEVRKAPFAQLHGAAVSVDDAIKIIERNRDYQSRPLNRNSLRELAGQLGQREALQRETADLEARYPEFSDLMQEYREGVLLFRAEQEAVWNRVAVKDSALRIYWADHKDEYRWPDRASFREIFVSSDSLGAVLRDSLNRGVDFGELAARHTQRAGYKEKKGDWGLQPATNELAKKALSMAPNWIEGPFKYQYGFSIIKAESKEEAREKTFEEAQSEVSSRFQEFESKRLEREWIEGLSRKYGVTIHEEALKNAFQDVKKKS
ncbi:MAG: peptidylprolyl isomerase [Ignavibacteria bacterium]|nr:peptidylprolyl isomerase [Ignavibacteria bacterium]